MSAYVIIDVEIEDVLVYQHYMLAVKPALEAAGGRYLARGGEHQVVEGDWNPRRLVIIEFPSIERAREFYTSDGYRELKSLREESSSSRMVLVAGL